ncbi:MAG: L,D-transpeptidase family protein [Pseudomonadota bacterium]
MRSIVPALAAASLLVSGCATSGNGPRASNQARPGVATEAKAPREPASAELRPDGQPLLDQRTLQDVTAAEDRYREIVSQGGWPTLPPGPSFRPGDGDPRTSVLARRLAISGDLLPRPAGAAARVNAGEIEAGLQRFQRRHGLRPTGVADAATQQALNVTAESRLAQLRANIARVRDLARTAPAKPYVLVNVPAFQLEAVDAGRVARRHRVIVGRVERPTPGVKAHIRNVNFMPYWHVPDSVARQDLIPHLQKDPDYLQREHIRVLTGWQGQEVSPQSINWRSPSAAELKFRQDPGPWNALGLVRLDMPNEHAVYLHDTPMKELFGQRERAMSAGCVRVESPADLVAWLLRGVPGWNRARVEETMASAQPLDVSLTEPVPVIFAYVTAWADAEGVVEFRSDLYRQDGVSELVANYSTSIRQDSASPRAIMSP